MEIETKKDRFGRTLARSRRNPRAFVVVETPAERLSDERAVALGASPGPIEDPEPEPEPEPPATDETSDDGDTDPDRPEDPESTEDPDGDVEYPVHKHGPNWELSDGSSFQGNREQAEAAQADLDDQNDEE